MPLPQLPYNGTFTANKAWLIAVQNYKHMTALRTPLKDVEELEKELTTQQGFTDVHCLPDPGKDQLITFIQSIEKKVSTDDRVLIYFAGHGMARNGDEEPAGFLLPADARPLDARTFIPMSVLNEVLDKLPCRHLLVVLDCCFAGSFQWTQTHRGIGEDIPNIIYQERFDQYLTDKARQVITSSAHDQQALDGAMNIGRREDHNNGHHSPFAGHLLDALRGGADFLKQGVMTATMIYAYLRQKTEQETMARNIKYRQTPGIFPLKDHDKGEFIFTNPVNPLNLPPRPDRNPYKGLLAFTEEDADFFYGREKARTELASRLEKQNLLIITGPSGSGKSSLVKAGLSPTLQQQGCKLIEIRPGTKPMTQLTALNFDPHQQQNNILFIDQYEELITRSDKEEARLFQEQLIQWITQQYWYKIIITVRADYETQFDRGLLKNYWPDARYVIRPLSREELREAIVQPAIQSVLLFRTNAVPAYNWEENIVDELLYANNPLPLLSFTMSELYQLSLVKKGRHRSLHEDDYRELGGVLGSLRHKAEDIYENIDQYIPDAKRSIKDVLSDKELLQDSFQRLMLRMIAVESGNIAGRRIYNDKMNYPDDGENGRHKALSDLLIRERLLVTGRDDNDTQGEYIEPSHDELLAGWPSIRQWITELGEDKLILLRRLEDVAIEYASKSEISYQAPNLDEQFREVQTLLWHDNPYLEDLEELQQQKPRWFTYLEKNFIEQSQGYRKMKIKDLQQKAARINAVNVANQVLVVKKTNPSLAIRLLEYFYEKVARVEARQSPQLLRELCNIYNVDHLNEHIAFCNQYFLPDWKNRTVGEAVFSYEIQRVAESSFQQGESKVDLFDFSGRLIKQLFKSSTISIQHLAYSTKGKYLCGYSDNTAWVWDEEGALCLQAESKAKIYKAFITPDENWLVTIDKDKYICLHSITIPGSDLGFYHFSFYDFDHHEMLAGVSNDNHYFYLAHTDNYTIYVFDISKLHLQQDKKIPLRSQNLSLNEKVLKVAIAPDGRHLLAVADKKVIYYEVGGDFAEIMRKAVDNDQVMTISFNDANDYFLIAMQMKGIQLYDRAGKEVVHDPAVPLLAYASFTEKPGWILWSSNSNLVLRQLFTGKQIRVVNETHPKFTRLCSETLYTMTIRKVGKIYDLAPLPEPGEEGNGIEKGCVFSPDGTYLLTGVAKQEGVLRRTPDGKTIEHLDPHNHVWCAAVHPVDNNLYATGSDNVIKLWQVGSTECIATYDGIDWSRILRFSPDGDYLLIADDHGKIYVLIDKLLYYNTHETGSFIRYASFVGNTGRIVIHTHEETYYWDFHDNHTDHLYSDNACKQLIYYSYSNTLLAMIGEQSRSTGYAVELWDVNRQLIWREQIDLEIREIGYCPRKNLLVIAGTDEAGKGYRLLIRNLQQRKDYVSDWLDYEIRKLCISPDESYIGMLLGDYSVRLYNLYAEEIFVMENKYFFDSLVFSPDGHSFVLSSTSRSTPVKIYKTPAGILQWLKQATLPALTEEQIKQYEIEF